MERVSTDMVTLLITRNTIAYVGDIASQSQWKSHTCWDIHLSRRNALVKRLWAENQNLAYTTFVDLSQKPKIYELISKDVDRVNRSLPPTARIRKFVLLHKEFDADEGELTRTRKLRRRLLNERYNNMISTMYSGGKTVRVQATFKYRDGRQGVIETGLRIATMDTEEAGL